MRVYRQSSVFVGSLERRRVAVITPGCLPSIAAASVPCLANLGHSVKTDSVQQYSHASVAARSTLAQPSPLPPQTSKIIVYQRALPRYSVRSVQSRRHWCL